MQLPRQVTFRNLDRSEAIEANIRERAEKLKVTFGRVMSCHTLVEAQHKRHQHGTRYHVRVDVMVPDGNVVANLEPDERHAYTDVYFAIREAFDSIHRQLENHGRQRSRQVTAH